MTRAIEQLAERFVLFADQTRDSSPLYTALSPRIARDRELLELLLAAPPTQRLPNLLFAAVHDLLLAGADHPLARHYPSLERFANAPAEAAFPAFRDICLGQRETLRGTIATRHTQTNEVRRSLAFYPVLQELSADGPIALVEIGASAGLNLLVDRYRYRYGDGPWSGPPGSPVALECEVRGATTPVPGAPLRIAFRVGLDSRPVDVREPGDARWLMACVWPEHVDRLQRLGAALEVARTDPPPLVAGDAVEALERVVAMAPAHLPVCLFHSAVIPYLSGPERTAFVATIERLGRQRPLHWLSLEGGGLQTFGADLPFSALYAPRPEDRPTDIFGLLGAARWVDGARHDRLLARVDMHGRWIEWLATAAPKDAPR